MRLRSQLVLSVTVCVLLGTGLPTLAQASAAAKGHGRKTVQAQLKDVEAKVSKAQDRKAELQAQVANMERENANREKRLKQRDDEIAALQKKLAAAGAPGAGASTGH